MYKIIVFLTLLVSSLSAQQYFSGEITQDTRWIGDIYIDGDVIIPRGVILSVETGSRIFFKPKTDVQNSGIDKRRSEIVVNGVLLAKGTNEKDGIIFTSDSKTARMNDWYGIILKNLYEKSTLTHCTIEFGYKGITCYGSAPEISDCQIQYNFNSGISCEVRSTPFIRNCSITNNGFTGLNCELASAPLVEKCLITQNNYGVLILSRSEPDLGHSGPFFDHQSIGENRIFNNINFNIYNHSARNIIAQNNLWNTLDPNEIRSTIYDNLDNPSYGQVVFQPFFRQRRLSRLPFPSTSSRSIFPKKSIAGSNAGSFKIKNFENQTRENADRIAGVRPQTTIVQPETVIKVLSDTVYVLRESTSKLEKISAANPTIKKPLLESFLDAGRREYLKKVQPIFPNIYMSTGKTGEVLLEVVVNRQGYVERYQVLKSDGDLFTASAVEAIKLFRYKPGTYHGKPVQFKVVEKFKFQKTSS